MTSIAWLQLALVAIAGVVGVLSLTILLTRVVRDAMTKRTAVRHARLRPMLLQLLSDDEPDLTPLDAVGGVDGRLLHDLAWSMVTKLRGSSRDALVEWLVNTGAVERAARATHSFSAIRRATAAEQLGAAGVADTTAQVERLLRDRHLDVRIVAARSLGKLGDPRAVPTLLATLDAKRPVPFGIIAMAIVHMGPAAVESLIAALGSRSAPVRSLAAELLGLQGALPAARHLTMLARHDIDLDVRVRAVSSLGRIGSPAPVDTISRLLAPAEDPRLRTAAAKALGLIGGAAAVSSLHLAVNDAHAGVSRAAAEALSETGPPGVEVLRAAAAGEGPGRAAATGQLFRRNLLDGSQRTRSRRPRVVA